MKRYGEKAAREALNDGAIIRDWEWFTLQAGYKVTKDGETLGYITFDLFNKLIQDGTIVKTRTEYSYSDYAIVIKEEEKATRTAEEITAAIIEFFKENEVIFNDCIEQLDDYNGYLGDDRYFSMSELDKLYYGTEPSEILRRAFFGAFNPNQDFVRHNAYGNLVSADYKDYSGQLDKYAVDSMSENRKYIDTIEYNAELAELFDELEQAAQ